MLFRLRVALVAVTAIGLLGARGLAPVTAVADLQDLPTPIRALSIAPAHTAVDLSATQWRAAGFVTKARNKAVSADGKTLDYRKMITIFGKPAQQVDWRRQAAAGFREAGGKITHISKTENRKVEVRRKQIYGSRKPPSASASSRSSDGVAGAMSGTNCKGKSGKVVINEHESHKYWNSCETIDLKYSWGTCVVAMGAIMFLTAKEPKVAVPAFLLGAACGLVQSDIDRNAAKSEVGAIYLRTYRQEAYQPYAGGVRYYIQYDLLPQ